jgi:hypothetical protein
LVVLVLALVMKTGPIAWRRSRRRRRFREAGETEPGEAPAQAYDIASASRIPHIMRALRCRCGASPPSFTAEPNEVSYMNETLLCQRARCPSCGQSMSRYFRCAEDK